MLPEFNMMWISEDFSSVVDSLSLDELKEVAPFDIPDLRAIPESFELEEANYFEEMDMATMHFNDNEHYLVLSLTTDKTEMLDESEPVSTENFEGSYMNMFDMHFLFWSQDEVHMELMTDADALTKEELIEVATHIQ
jgi:hypothetical protein